VIPGAFLCVCQIEFGEIGIEWGGTQLCIDFFSFLPFLDWAFSSDGGVDPRELNLLTEFTQTTSEEVIQDPSNRSGKSRSGAFESVLETREQVPQGE